MIGIPTSITNAVATISLLCQPAVPKAEDSNRQFICQKQLINCFLQNRHTKTAQKLKLNYEEVVLQCYDLMQP